MMHCVVPGGGVLDAITGGAEGCGAGHTRGAHVCGAACMDPRQSTATCPSMHPQTHSAAAVPAQANEAAARAAAEARATKRLLNPGAECATRMPESHFFTTAPFMQLTNLRRKGRCLLGELGECQSRFTPKLDRPVFRNGLPRSPT